MATSGTLFHDCQALQVCCSVLQCVAVCCSVLQCVAMCCCVVVLCGRPIEDVHFGWQRLVGSLSVFQCVAVCCSVMQCVAVCCSVMQCVAVCCSGYGVATNGMLSELLGLFSPRALLCRNYLQKKLSDFGSLFVNATPYSLQHTATLCNTLQHTAAHCSTLQHTATLCNTLQHTATHCNTLKKWTRRCESIYKLLFLSHVSHY